MSIHRAGQVLYARRKVDGSPVTTKSPSWIKVIAHAGAHPTALQRKASFPACCEFNSLMQIAFPALPCSLRIVSCPAVTEPPAPRRRSSPPQPTTLEIGRVAVIVVLLDLAAMLPGPAERKRNQARGVGEQHAHQLALFFWACGVWISGAALPSSSSGEK
jgi:hypothetical protein